MCLCIIQERLSFQSSDSTTWLMNSQRPIIRGAKCGFITTAMPRYPRVMPAFGQTAFGQNRIWPKKSEFGQFVFVTSFGQFGCFCVLTKFSAVVVVIVFVVFVFVVVVVVPGCCCLLLLVVACWWCWFVCVWWVCSRFSGLSHLSVPALQTPPKFHEKTPREREERMNFPVGERKNSAKFWAPHPSDPPPFGPPPFGRGPTPPGPHQNKKLANAVWPTSVKFGQIRMAKTGLAK